MQEIKRFLESPTRVTIAVVGDCLVDEYYAIAANRVSPEFPIPVLESPNSIPCAVPGGAGNVINQFKHFNVEATCLGLMDQYGDYIYNQAGIDTRHCVKIDTNIPIKRRLYNGDFPLCRWDIEVPGYGIDDLRPYQLELNKKYLASPHPHVLILSDYHKGVFIGNRSLWFNRSDVITLVDPKHGPIESWRGCTIFKPNAKEAKELSGKSNWKEQCDYFEKVLGCEAVIITQSGDGFVGSVKGEHFDYRPKQSIVPTSVIGAGDCFVAFMAIALARGLSCQDSAVVAFHAATLYVQKKHNEPITPEELLKLIDPGRAKIVKPESLVERNFKLVFTNGCFDVLHIGHVKTLQAAKQQGDKLVVAVNSDDSVRRLKGESRPIHTLDHRMEMLANLEFVDYVTCFDSDDPYNLIKLIKPDVLVKGADWAGKIIGADLVENVYVAPIVEGYSSTKIIELK